MYLELQLLLGSVYQNALRLCDWRAGAKRPCVLSSENIGAEAED